MNLYARIAATIVLGVSTTAFAGSVCPVALDGVQTGFPENVALTEISGMVASRNNLGVFWVHNDSGDGPRVYALTGDGTHLGTYDLQGASAVDYEDIALGPGPMPGIDYLYVGDIGDNLSVRSSVVVYRVPEPSVDVNQAPVSVTLTGVDALPMEYPATVYDSETLLLDPVTTDLYLVSKDADGSGDNGTSFLFHNPAPHAAGVLTTMTQVGSIALGGGVLNRATGGDLSPSGDTILLRSYVTLRAWPRASGVAVADAMAEAPCILPLRFEAQGESVAFNGDGTGYYTTSEHPTSAVQPIYFYQILATEDPIDPDDVYVTFGGANGNGASTSPFDNFAEAVAAANAFATINIDTGSTGETFTGGGEINKALTILNNTPGSGSVVVGSPPARVPSGSTSSGFVSRDR